MSFVSVMKAIGKDIEKVFLSPWFQTGVHIAEGVVGLAVPALGPAFNLTAQAIMTAEANFAAVGQSSGTGPQKLASVIQSSGNLIAQALKDAGVSAGTQAEVAAYISSVVTILNSTPFVPAPAPGGVTPGGG
jgi:hypothetical protein